MHEMPWLDHLPNSTLEGGRELLEGFLWHIEIQHISEFWCVYAGECIIYRTDSKEAAEAFVYGLALAYAALPEHILKNLQQQIEEWSL